MQEKEIFDETRTLQDTHDLFTALSFIHGMHSSIMQLLNDLATGISPDSPDFADAVNGAHNEMMVAGDMLDAFQKKLHARMDTLGMMRGDMRH